MADIFNMLDTWNASGTTFTGIKLSVTDTASAAGSLLMDLQVGGVSRFAVEKTGVARAEGLFRVGGNNGLQYQTGGTYGGSLGIIASGALRAILGGSIIFGNGQGIQWDSGGSPGTLVDLILARDAANTLAQRNGVNAQAFNLYNTYTDASNYERGFMSWSHTANRLVVGTGALGTGTNRSIQLGAGNGGVSLLTSSTGRVDAYANEFTINNTVGAERLRVDAVGSVRIATGLTVATLPSTPLVGMMARVTNATTPTVGSTVTGGGAAAALCWYNGTNWTVIGV